MPDYGIIDRSNLLHYLFYPRQDYRRPPSGAFDLQVSVEPDVAVACRAYTGSIENPWILFFHGNGEVIADYDGIAPLYNHRGINLLVSEYRGYGASGGRPTMANLISDAHAALITAREELLQRGFKENIYVMGRSLGSIAALELARRYPDSLRGLIIESGFISVVNLIEHLGLPAPGHLSLLEKECREAARAVTMPALILHGAADNLVPLSQGRALYQHLGSAEKELVIIPGGDHNNIMFTDLDSYMGAICKFLGF